MSIRGLVDGMLRRGIQRQLADINRPYYAQSLFLFTACRYLPLPDSALFGQCKEYRELLAAVERAVKGQSRRTLFVAANEALVKYFRDYEPSFTDDIYYELPGLMKLQALPILTKVEIAVSQNISEMFNSKWTIMVIELWEDEPIICHSGGINEPLKHRYNSIMLPTIKIHEGATLTVLLHRLMEHSLVLPETNAIHLCQFPQFYQRFPLTNFTRKIPCLYPWTTIRDDAGVKYLHLIMDRSDTCVRTWNGIRSEYVNLPDMCGNAWQIGRDLLVVRDRTRSFALSTWNPQTSFAMPLPLHISQDDVPPPLAYRSKPSFGESTETLVTRISPSSSPCDSTGRGGPLHYYNTTGSDSDSTIAPCNHHSSRYRLYPCDKLASNGSNGSVSNEGDDGRLDPARVIDHCRREPLCDTISINTVDTNQTFFTAAEPRTPSSMTSNWSYRQECTEKEPLKGDDQRLGLGHADNFQMDTRTPEYPMTQIERESTQTLLKFPSLLDTPSRMQRLLPPLREEDILAHIGGDTTFDSGSIDGVGNYYCCSGMRNCVCVYPFQPNCSPAAYNNNVGNYTATNWSNVGNSIEINIYCNSGEQQDAIYFQSPVDSESSRESHTDDPSTPETFEGRRHTT